MGLHKTKWVFFFLDMSVWKLYFSWNLSAYCALVSNLIFEKVKSFKTNGYYFLKYQIGHLRRYIKTEMKSVQIKYSQYIIAAIIIVDAIVYINK